MQWVALSFYETSPAEIKRHLDIVNALDQIHRTQKVTERNIEQARHQTSTIRQRDMFHRQRAEVAMRYQAAGLPVRPSYAWEEPTTLGASGTQGSAHLNASLNSQLPHSQFSPSARQQSPPNAGHTTTTARVSAEGSAGLPQQHSRESISSSGSMYYYSGCGPSDRVPLQRPMTTGTMSMRYRSLPLPKPTFVKVSEWAG